MRKLFIILLTLNFQLLTCYSLFSQTVYADYIDGEVYVKLTPAALKPIYRENPNNVPVAALGEAGRVLTKYGVTKVVRSFHQASDDADLPRILRVYFSNAQAVNALMNELKNTAGIEYAERVPLAKIDAMPNDPTFPAHLNQINAQNAWDIFNGNSNITVAIVDNAVMWTHADLAANVYTNPGEIPNNNIDDDGNGYIDDVNGWDAADLDGNAVPTNSLMDHGTHCAGIAGASTDNGTGVASIGWNIKIIPVKCQNDAGNVFSVPFGYEGIIYAAKANARVISCSWSGFGSALSEQLVIDYAWNRGCIVIVSAGNNNNNTPTYPGAYNRAYCVAAVDNNDVKLGISSYGTWVNIAAPGFSIMSTVPYTTAPTYSPMSGTSQAAPVVAGLAALMLSQTPYMTQDDVLNCISNTAVNIYTLGGNAAYAVGSQLGAGRIEAYQAMLCAASFSTALPVANFYAKPVESCPNTAIAFSDSSLYQPTTWSWTFQGGTPATSTLSNPSVQWALPGTYSVSLTVSNANGNDTKTKTSYITITNPINLPFAEGFQNAQFLPANWTDNTMSGDNVYWSRITNVGGFGTSSACAVFNNYTVDVAGERDEMHSPKFIFSDVASARLRFDVAYARYNPLFSDTLEVKVSTDCGTNWTSIYLKGGTTLATVPADMTSQFTPSANQWRTDSMDISALTAGQGNVMFSFVNRGHFGQAIYVDNINLAFPTPTLNVTASESTVCVGTAVNFSHTSSGASSYTWTFGANASSATSTLANPSVSYSVAGVYTVTLIGANYTTTTAVTKTIAVNATPTITISPSSATVCSGSHATLTASGASSYTWSTNALTGSVAVSPTTATVYTVTGNNVACPNSQQTISIYVDTPPSLTMNPSSTTVCSGSNATLTASGANSYTWSTGAQTATVSVSPTNTLSVYTVTASNNNACAPVFASITISVIPLAMPVLTVTNPSCTNVCTGAVDIVSGLNNPYTFTLTNSTCTTLPCTNLCDGLYTLYTNDNLGCNTSNIFSIACANTPTPGVGQVNLNEASVMIYPNPAQNELNIVFPKTFGYVLYNSIGQIILSRKNISAETNVNVSSFAKGIYLLEVQSEDFVVRKKVVLE